MNKSHIFEYITTQSAILLKNHKNKQIHCINKYIYEYFVFFKEKVLFTYFSIEIKQIFCESLSHRITCCNMSFLPSLWNVMFAGGVGPACLPVWLPACLVNKDLRPTLDEPFYTSFQHCLNVIAHIIMTHQPFLLDSSWTFTCHPWRKKYKRPFKEHMYWNYLMELLDTHCNHLLFFLFHLPSISRSWTSFSLWRRSLKHSISTAITFAQQNMQDFS